MRNSPRKGEDSSLQCWFLPFVLTLLQATALLSQPRVETFQLKAYRLSNQPAREALALVEPLLSARGTVELRLAENTLVLRDTSTVIRQVAALLREFDHPPRELPFEIHLLQARRASPRSDPADNTRGLPPGLVESLGMMARWNHYSLLAAITLRSREGEEVSYELGGHYEVRFVVGTVLLDRHVRLRGFEVLRQMGELDRRLFYGHLNLEFGKTTVVAVAGSGLAVAVTCAPKASGTSEDGVGEP